MVCACHNVCWHVLSGSDGCVMRVTQETLRGLGVEEQLVRLPPSPNADPDNPPGTTGGSYLS